MRLADRQRKAGEEDTVFHVTQHPTLTPDLLDMKLKAVGAKAPKLSATEHTRLKAAREVEALALNNLQHLQVLAALLLEELPPTQGPEVGKMDYKEEITILRNCIDTIMEVIGDAPRVLHEDIHQRLITPASQPPAYVAVDQPTGNALSALSASPGTNKRPKAAELTKRISSSAPSRYQKRTASDDNGGSPGKRKTKRAKRRKPAATDKASSAAAGAPKPTSSPATDALPPKTPKDKDAATKTTTTTSNLTDTARVFGQEHQKSADAPGQAAKKNPRQSPSKTKTKGRNNKKKGNGNGRKRHPKSP